MNIQIDQPVSVPGCPDQSVLITATVDGDEAQVRVYPDRGWQLLRSSGEADSIADWSFLTSLHPTRQGSK